MTTICCSPVIMDKMTWISCIPHSAVSSCRFFDLFLIGAKCSLCAEVLFTVGDRLGIVSRCFVADLYVLEPFFPFIFEPLASMAVHARSYISLRWPSPSSVCHS